MWPYFRRCFAYLHGAITKLLNNAWPIVQKRKFWGENIENYLAASKSTTFNFLRRRRLKWYLVISPTSDFANVTFANVFGRLANAMSRLANVLLVTSPMY